MSGTPEDLSPQQAEILKQFKTRVSDVMKPQHDDRDMLRWLRARGFDLKKAEKMFRDSMEWRRKNGMDTILEDYKPPEVLEKFSIGGFCGTDKEGCPIWIDYLGKFDIKGMLHCVKKQDIIKCRLYKIEQGIKELEESNKKTGKHVDQVVCIADLEGAGVQYLWKPAMEMGIQLLKDVEANYPERLKVGYAVNAVKVFPILFNMVKPFMSEQTKKKIEVLGGGWKSRLREAIDPSELPVHWGGTKTGPDGDEFCSDLILTGGKIDKKYYLKNQEELSDLTGFTKTEVGRGSSLQLEYKVDDPGSVLRYNFWTDDKDIAFGVFRRKVDKRQKVGDMEAVQETKRVDSHVIPEEGTVLCYAAGTYVVRFDNTYSWVSAKKLYYHIEVLAPDTNIKLYDNDNNLVDVRL